MQTSIKNKKSDKVSKKESGVKSKNNKVVKFSKVLQFRIDLKYMKPPVWRRIQVPENFTFYDLHFLIQDIFEWDNDHLHEFSRTANRNNLGRLFRGSDRVAIGMKKDPIGFPMDSDMDVLNEEKEIIADWFDMENRIMGYVYDFGDDWQHNIKLEKILEIDRNKKYPILLESHGEAPQEDCGDLEEDD